jgi:hypothetical protein
MLMPVLEEETRADVEWLTAETELTYKHRKRLLFSISGAAACKSASSKIIIGVLPPSSV